MIYDHITITIQSHFGCKDFDMFGTSACLPTTSNK